MTQTVAPSALQKTTISKSGAIHFDLSRSEVLGKMIMRLKRNSIVVITGESGSGKSTFVRETLCNELLKEDKPYRIAINEPFADPIGHLADALLQPKGLFPSSTKDPNFRTYIENELRKGGDAIARLCQQAARENGKPDFNFLLIVDQKQELFRYQNIMKNLGKAGDDVLFISLLLNAIKSNALVEFEIPIYIVFVANTNNFEYFSRYRGLPEIMNTYNIPFPDVTKEELSNALENYLPEPELHEKWCTEFEQMTKVGDPYALQKLNLFLSLRADKSLKTLYSSEGEMSGIIKKFVENEVWLKFTTEEKKHVEYLFKAITFKNGIKNDRIPLPIETLQKWSGREGAIDVKEIKKLLSSFNQYNQAFILPAEWQPGAIVDIDSEALIKNWPRLQMWIDEEKNDAMVYRSLITAGRKYFAETGKNTTENLPEKQVNAFSENMQMLKKWVAHPLNHKKETLPIPKDKLIYKGAMLDSVRTLIVGPNKDQTIENFRQWASGYTPIKLNKPGINQPYVPEHRNIGEMSDLDIAIKFYQICDQQEKAEEDSKATTLKKEQQLRRRSQLWTFAATIASLVAMVALYRTYQENLNIKMINYVRLLDAKDMFYPTNKERFGRMSEMIDIVKSGKINSWEKVLDTLTHNGYLQLDIPDPDLRDISKDALLNIQHFYEARRTDRDEQKYVQELNSIYDRAIQYPTTQSPAVYHALLSELKERTKNGKPIPRTANIEKNALISNPRYNSEFAFGDKNGRVFIVHETMIDTLPEMGDFVNSMGYSKDGNHLYVGSQRGNIAKYDLSKFPIQKKLIYKDNSSIYFIAESNRGQLLVNNGGNLYILEDNGASNTEQYKPVHEAIPTELERVSQVGWSKDYHWILATGKDYTHVYAFNPDETSTSSHIQKAITIKHTGTTMLDFDIKFDSINGVPSTVWLALGSERGDVWIMHKPLSLLAPGILDLAEFEQYRDTLEHRSSITGLEFNPKLPQLASSSRDGRVLLWNLETPLGSRYDHIRVTNGGESISAIAYISADELVVYESTRSWKMKTNIKALKAELDRVRGATGAGN